ncbi:MAG: SAM-dependent chlorinase/fluorinase [Betaproteobacteria bacterium]|nr:SAM-dependent chlorinase/fluorinase [Betaproteobacteria bacterium]
MIFLFTDYGSNDVYAGQVRGVLAGEAPGVAVIDLLHETPAFNVRAGACGTGRTRSASPRRLNWQPDSRGPDVSAGWFSRAGF